MNHYLRYMHVCKELIRADFMVFKQMLKDRCINLTIWMILTITVMGYILPYFGLPKTFGVFQLGGLLAAIGLFEMHNNIITMVSDFDGDRIIDYHLTLPIPSWLAILSKGIYFFLVFTFLTIIMIPVGKVLVWQQLDLAQIGYAKLLLILVVQNIFYAFSALWIAGSLKTIHKVGNVWMRIIFPMFFMGGFQFSWVALNASLPLISYISLINPMIYITEGVRGAMLGQTGYLNFWICVTAVLLFAGVAIFFGMRTLKKRLDFV